MTVIKGNDARVYKRRLMIQYLFKGVIFFAIFSVFGPMLFGREVKWEEMGYMIFAILVVQVIRYLFKRTSITNSEVCLMEGSEAPSVIVRTYSSKCEEEHQIYSIDRIEYQRSGMVVIGDIKAKYVELSEEGNEHKSMAESIVIPPCFRDMKEIGMRMQEHLKSS